MERVTFLIEKTGERLDCLLNPESLEITRKSGLRQRQSVGGPVTGRGAAHDSLVYTSGGITELKLDLLFDVSLKEDPREPADETPQDVRDMTQRIWSLAENVPNDEGFGEIAVARLVWGKAWNIPGVVVAVAERFERFTSDGIPQRSWLRMRFRQVPETDAESVPEAEQQSQEGAGSEPQTTEGVLGDFPVESSPGGAAEESEPADEDARTVQPMYLAVHDLGLPPSSWRSIAAANGIEDPFHVPTGTALKIPSA